MSDENRRIQAGVPTKQIEPADLIRGLIFNVFAGTVLNVWFSLTILFLWIAERN